MDPECFEHMGQRQHWMKFNNAITINGVAEPQAPAENRIRVAIRAGEKVLHAEGEGHRDTRRSRGYAIVGAEG
jgi:hypothetical protein